ncbi:MAG: FHA domain-containing protein, partial [Planctomycetota bacterium]
MSFQLRNESTGEIHVLEEKRISIGSADSSNIVIKDPGVPPTQCFLSKTKLGYFLMNFSPDSHITINDEDIKEKMLKLGDRIHIGDSTYLLEEMGAAGGEAPAEAETPPEEKPAESPPEAPEKAEPAPTADEAQAESPPAETPPSADEGPKEGEGLQEPPAEGKGVEEKPATAEAPAAPPVEEPPPPWEVSPEVGAAAAQEPEKPAAGAGGEDPVPMSPEEAERLFGEPPETPDATGTPKATGTAPYSLKIHGGSKDGEVVDVFEKITVGRADENDLVLISKAISRRHAEFSVAEGKFYIRDLGSASGVRVNGARIREDTLNAGDQVEIGDIILVV